MTPSASRLTLDPTTLQIATLFDPQSFACRSAPSVSAVSPDWEIATVSVERLSSGTRYRYSEAMSTTTGIRSEEHTSELQSRLHLVCRLLLEKKKNKKYNGNLKSQDVRKQGSARRT